ncbi:hypothetical protein C5613_39950 [Rhodococcus opacus]|uniref:4Fe-4S Wbl-type domain-containing protein n=1 Tax=Rhodococcus opacus TaxID=37919 RepID=A0A2S8IK64_RHOOP|nr:hypothetical protein C5613_39950 [Rhodococcus opacus]
MDPGRPRRARGRGHSRFRCRLVGPCRDRALVVGEPYGVWGGMTEGDRRKHSRRSRRGDPAPSTC